MRNLLAIVIAASLSAASCHAPKPAEVVADVVECARLDAAKIKQLAPLVETLLLSGDLLNAGALLDALTVVGVDILACTIDKVIHQMTTLAGATPEKISNAKKLAEAWKTKYLPHTQVK